MRGVTEGGVLGGVERGVPVLGGVDALALGVLGGVGSLESRRTIVALAAWGVVKRGVALAVGEPGECTIILTGISEQPPSRVAGASP